MTTYQMMMETQKFTGPFGKELLIYKIHDGDGKAVAVIILGDRPDCLRITTLWVVPEHRGKGYAGQLLSKALNEADRKQKAVYMECDSFVTPEHPDPGVDDDTLRKMYIRAGFQNITGHPFAMVRYPLDMGKSFTDN